MFASDQKTLENRYMVVLTKTEVYLLDLKNLVKQKLDEINNEKFTGMCTFVDEITKRAMIVVSKGYKFIESYYYMPPFT